MDKPAKKGFLTRIFEDNREFDSTMTIFFVFFCFASSLGAVIVGLFLQKTIPTEFFDILNVFENFILMILSYFFTRATTTGSQQK